MKIKNPTSLATLRTKNAKECEGVCICSTENLPAVIRGLIISGDLFISAIAAIGIPQFATGPQKC